MSNVIEITDQGDAGLVHALPIILKAIEAKARDLVWSGFYLEAEGEPADVVASIGEASENPGPGHLFSWGQMRSYAKATSRIRNGIFIGVEAEKDLVLRASEYDLYTSYPVYIEVFEGKYWRMAAADPALLDAVAGCFSATTRVPLAA